MKELKSERVKELKSEGIKELENLHYEESKDNSMLP